MSNQIQALDKKINAIYEKHADEYNELADKSENLFDRQAALDKEREELRNLYEALEEKTQINSLIEFCSLLKQRENLKKVDTYPEHRAKAVMYNWLSLVEKTDGNAEPFLQMMADNFSVDFGGGTTYNTKEALAGWVKNTATSVI